MILTHTSYTVRLVISLTIITVLSIMQNGHPTYTYLKKKNSYFTTSKSIGVNSDWHIIISLECYNDGLFDIYI